MVTTHTQDVSLTQLIEQEIAIQTIDAGIILDWVTDNFQPGDIFEIAELSEWAIDNGFVEEDGS